MIHHRCATVEQLPSRAEFPQELRDVRMVAFGGESDCALVIVRGGMQIGLVGY
jgi:hypothetical protein